MKTYLKSRNKLSIEYFRALVAVAMVDGKLTDEEEEFFHIKAEELGFQISSLQEMYSIDIDSLLISNTVNTDDVDYLSDIVAMAMIDGEIHEKEYELCVNLAQRKGFTRKDVDSTIQQLKEFISEQNISH